MDLNEGEQKCVWRTLSLLSYSGSGDFPSFVRCLNNFNSELLLGSLPIIALLWMIHSFLILYYGKHFSEMDRKGSVAMLTSIQSAGVTPEVTLRITQVRKHARDPPWFWDPGQTSPEVQTGISVAPWKGHVSEKFSKKNIRKKILRKRNFRQNTTFRKHRCWQLVSGCSCLIPYCGYCGYILNTGPRWWFNHY